jgi:hypothetical protein
MTFVFLDHVCFWRRYFDNWLCGTDVLAGLIHMALCCCIRFEKVFMYVNMLWCPVWIFVHKHCDQSVPAQHVVEEQG